MAKSKLGLSRTVVYAVIVVIVAIVVGFIPILYYYRPTPKPAITTVTTSTATTSTSSSTVTTTSTATTATITTTSTTTTAVNPYVQFFQSTPVGPVTLSINQLNSLESVVPSNVVIYKQNNTIVFKGNVVYILVIAGPPPSYLSFQVFNLTNPTIVVPEGALVKVLVVDDGVLPHSFGLVSKGPPYPSSVSPDQYPPPFPGSQLPQSILISGLSPATTSSVSGYMIMFNATTPGTYWYICFVPGHAASGMYGEFVVTGG